MARPITVTGVRRLADGSPVEARTAGGNWIMLENLTAGSLARVNDFWQQHNGQSSVPFPVEAFLIEVSDDIEPANTGGSSTAPTSMSTDGDAGDDGDAWQQYYPPNTPTGDDGGTGIDSSTGDSGAAGMPEPQPSMPSLDDMVRRIATELDQQVLAHVDGIENFLCDYINNAIEAQAGKASTGAIQRIELVRPNMPDLPADGLFHHAFGELTRNVAGGFHTYLPGPPGTGKTHAVKQVADLLGWKFGMITCGPQMGESAFYGGMDAHGRFHETPLIACMRHAIANPDSGAVFLCDELDNGNSSTGTTLNTLLADGGFQTRQGEWLDVGKNFVVVGTANTYGTGPTKEFSGRNRLDAAFLDRFLYLPWPTDEAVEEVLVRSYIRNSVTADLWLASWRTLRSRVEERDIKFFVTMRGCVTGARLVAMGSTVQDALMAVAGNKLPADQWDSVKPVVAR